MPTLTSNSKLGDPGDELESRVPDVGDGGRWFRAVRATAVIAGLFSAVILFVLAIEQLRWHPADVLEPPEIQSAIDQLRGDPNNETLKAAVRDLDTGLRARYFRELSLKRTGRLLLLAGIVVFAIAVKRALDFHRKLPMPAPLSHRGNIVTRSAERTRMTVGVLSVAMVSGLLWLTVSHASLSGLAIGSFGAGAGMVGSLPLPEPMPSWPSEEELLVNWPRFRGAAGDGACTNTNLATHWDTPNEVGIVWKSAVPAQGFNSPIVWGDRLFLSGGDREHRFVFAYDVSTGRLVWTCPIKGVVGSPVEPPDIPEETGFAAATMATDGRLVFVIFANGDLVGVGLDGTVAWSKNLGVPNNPFGHATSLIVWRDQLIVQMDQDEGEKTGSGVYGLDTATGRSLWRRSRPVPSSWATPIVIEPASGPQLITLGDPWVIAYKPSDGTELWRAECLEGEVTPSPVYAGGMVLVVCPSSRLVAIRPDGQGDVTASQVAWKSEAEIPDITSPVANDQRVFTVNTGGVLTCFSTVDGSRVWEHELNMDVHASPSLVGDQLYLISVTGTLVVADVRTEFREVWRQELGEKVSASPAFAGGRIFVRGEKQLFCIGVEGKSLEVQTVER